MSFNYVPQRTIEVPVINFKEKISLSPEKTALIIVDMQNDFVKDGGSLVVEAADDKIISIQKLLNAARKAGVRVAFTQDTHYESDPEWQIWPEHCRANTWGWEIIEELKPQPGEMVFQKSRYDGFYGTSLEHYLSRDWDVKHLVIVGTVSSICVAHTAASAGLRWFHIVVPADGISALTEFDQALTLRQVSWLYPGDVVKSTKDIRFEN